MNFTASSWLRVKSWNSIRLNSCKLFTNWLLNDASLMSMRWVACGIIWINFCDSMYVRRNNNIAGVCDMIIINVFIDMSLATLFPRQSQPSRRLSHVFSTTRSPTQTGSDNFMTQWKLCCQFHYLMAFRFCCRCRMFVVSLLSFVNFISQL